MKIQIDFDNPYEISSLYVRFQFLSKLVKRKLIDQIPEI